MKRVLSVVVLGAWVQTSAAVEAPSAKVCAQYAEADHDYQEALREPHAVYTAAMQEASAAAEAASREPQAARAAALQEAEAVYDSDMQAAKAAYTAILEAGEAAHEATVERALTEHYDAVEREAWGTMAPTGANLRRLIRQADHVARVATSAAREATSAAVRRLGEEGQAAQREAQDVLEAALAAGADRNEAFDAKRAAVRAAVERKNAGSEAARAAERAAIEAAHRRKDAVIAVLRDAEAARRFEDEAAVLTLRGMENDAQLARKQATDQANAAYAAAVEGPTADFNAAHARESEIYNEALQDAERDRDDAYLEIYEDDDGAESDVPAVMAKLRKKHRQLCKRIHGL